MNKNYVINEILKTAYKAVPKKVAIDGNRLIEIHNEIGSILDKYALGAVSNNEVAVCDLWNKIEMCQNIKNGGNCIECSHKIKQTDC